MSAPKPCSHVGCGVLVRDGSARCTAHKIRDGAFGDARRGSPAERGYGTDWRKLREQILKRDLGLCQACAANGRTQPARHVDHVIPKAQGGTDHVNNLQALCVPCHKRKTAIEGRSASAHSFTQ